MTNGRKQTIESTFRKSAAGSVSAEAAIGAVAVALAVAAMAVDHLIPGDAPAFLITSTISLAVAAVIFGHVIPRTKAGPAAPVLAAKRGMLFSGVAVLSIPTLFVGLPFVLGSAGVALGLLGREGERRPLAFAALALGALVVLFSVGVYVVLGDSGG